MKTWVLAPFIAAAVVVGAGSASRHAPAPNPHLIVDGWEDTLRLLYSEDPATACNKETGPAPGPINCNVFLPRALKRLFDIDAFTTNEIGHYLSANAIAKALVTDGDWESLGTAEKEANRVAAQNAANSKRAVIAVWNNTRIKSPDGLYHGHVALIIPGKAIETGWGKNVPNTASFVMGVPDKSFIGKPMSQAFRKDSQSEVAFYAYKD